MLLIIIILIINNLKNNILYLYTDFCSYIIHSVYNLFKFILQENFILEINLLVFKIIKLITNLMKD